MTAHEKALKTYEILQRRKLRKEQQELHLKHDATSVMVESRKRHRWSKTREI